MSTVVYMLKSVLMLLVAWSAIRIVGKKSIAEMTSYDLAAVMLITTVAAEPLVYKITSKATVGVITLSLTAIFLDILSLKRFFYNIDSRPTIIIVDGKIIDKEFKKVRMSIPLLLSELRVKGYQDISNIKYALIEANGKMSVIPKPEVKPITPKDMNILVPPINLSFSLIMDGQVDDKNLNFLQKDRKWLLNQLKAYNVENFNEVFLAQYDSSGNLFINLKGKEVKTPNIS